jgi:UDP-3-O-[3-hydroxymyristoyl] N-acetylglucosamine deacetylase/3-hydroxyacyl-[acyl-carrier-protein] dehydratase
MSAQRTIARPASVTGIGLHSGESCTLTAKPAPADTGVVFVRTDLAGQPSLRAHPAALCQRQRRSALATTVNGVEVEVHTPEHFLAACQGLGIDNLYVELSAVEFPGLDGSAREFVDMLRSAGVVEQGSPLRSFDVTDPVTISDGRTSLVALPWKNGLKITYTLDDHGGALGGAQVVEVELGEESFARDIAPARTFCLAKEVAMLRSIGLGKGATYQNTCVYDGDRLIDNTLRFKDEAARHKVLDLIGDLAHVARRLNAHIIAVRSGHRENMLLVQALNQRIEQAERPKVVFDIQAILDRLPHRYPFLLVDRVIEHVPGKRLVAIKNVTMNEPFFQGHFPGLPVMPGVLQLEAMAQAGGILLITDCPDGDRVPFLMSIDKAKFRRPVVPGDQLRIEIDVLRIRPRLSACAARVLVDGQMVSEAEIRSVMMERNATSEAG